VHFLDPFKGAAVLEGQEGRKIASLQTGIGPMSPPMRASERDVKKGEEWKG
jgi:hypothetical protein